MVLSVVGIEVIFIIGLVLTLIILITILARQRLVNQRLHREIRQQRQICQSLEQQIETQGTELTLAYQDRDHARQAKQKFMAHINHELQAPLNVILGLSQGLQARVKLPRQQESIGVIYNCAEYLFEAIGDILMVAALEGQRVPLRITDVDVEKLLETLEAILTPLAEGKGLRLCCDRNIDVPPFIQTDGGKLRQILVHLLSNAIKFTNEGRVELQVSLSQPNQDLNLGQTVGLCFSVIDTGIGIAAPELEVIYNSFRQMETGQHHQGVGLGLTLSHHFAKLLGGQLRLNSIVGRGSVFTCEIPAKIVSPPLLENWEEQVDTLPHLPQHRVLVADTQATVRHLLSILLARMGFDVQIAHNGLTVITLQQRFHYHLIWLDLQLQAIHAVDVIRQLKSAPNPPIIIGLVSHMATEDWTKALAAGCDDFVHKPLSAEVIWEKISTHLDIASSLNAEKATPLSLDRGNRPVITAQLGRMDLPWRCFLKDAVINLDAEAVVQSIDSVPFIYSELKQELAWLVENAQYHVILNMLEEMEG